MDNEFTDKLIKLGALLGMLNAAKELVQGESLVGGHRGYSDSMLTDVINEVIEEIEFIKAQL